jgi:uncharacterized repeat protein (TIGR01451 family)
LDIIAGTIDRYIYAWNTGTPYNPDRLPWPVARHDLRRTAYIDPREALPNLNASYKTVDNAAPQLGESIQYTIRLQRSGRPLSATVQISDMLPAGLLYIPGSLNATLGNIDDSAAPMLRWSGLLSNTNLIEIHYEVSVTTPLTQVIVNTVTIDGGSAGQFTRRATVIANGFKSYLPLTNKN